MIEDILDADQVGELLHVHPRTIIRLANQTEIPDFKVGDQWRFRRQAIEQYIKDQEQRYRDRQKLRQEANGSSEEQNAVD